MEEDSVQWETEPKRPCQVGYRDLRMVQELCHSWWSPYLESVNAENILHYTVQSCNNISILIPYKFKINHIIIIIYEP